MAENEDSLSQADSIMLTSEIVAAYVGNNSVDAEELPSLIGKVYSAMSDLSAAGGKFAAAKDPAVPVSKSITPDYIICLEDGKKLKMLKRYLRTHYDLSPEEYRRKWGLPADYPMVAPNYAKHRSKVAKQFGLGTTTTKRATSKKKTTKKRATKKK